MHFDPYEKPEARRRRHMSNICLAIVILLFFAGVVSLFFRNTVAEPYYFDHFELSDEQMLGEQDSQFYLLNSRFSADSSAVSRDERFESAYPTVNSLLLMQNEVYSEDKPYAEYCGDYLCVAQVYPSVISGVRTLDVALFHITASVDGGTARMNMLGITKYTIRYDASSGEISYLPYSDSTYRLSVNSISLGAVGGSVSGDFVYSISFNEPFTAEQLDKLSLDKALIDDINHSFHKPVYSSTDYYSTLTTTADGGNFADGKVLIKYDLTAIGDMFHMSDFSVTYRQADDIKFIFEVN